MYNVCECIPTRLYVLSVLYFRIIGEVLGYGLIQKQFLQYAYYSCIIFYSVCCVCVCIVNSADLP